MDDLVNSAYTCDNVLTVVEAVLVVTSDGRNMIGVLQGFDQTTNLILEKCTENVYSPSTGKLEQVELGLFIVRGNTV
jgi:U6 snRNA-associated Sm-like protein LSm8